MAISTHRHPLIAKAAVVCALVFGLAGASGRGRGCPAGSGPV